MLPFLSLSCIEKTITALKKKRCFGYLKHEKSGVYNAYFKKVKKRYAHITMKNTVIRLQFIRCYKHIFRIDGVFVLCAQLLARVSFSFCWCAFSRLAYVC